MPFVGWALGLLTALGFAAVQFWPDYVPILMVGGVFAAGQVLDVALLSPKIVGKKIGLHPVWLIFSLFVFSYLFGFVGMLVAVPVAAAIGVLVRFALEVYLQSPVYRGKGPATGNRGMTASARPRARAAGSRSAAPAGARGGGFSRLQLECAGVELVDRWPHWRLPAAIVAGPEGSGKSHLAHVWQLKSGAAVDRGARPRTTRASPSFESVPALGVEDIDRGIAERAGAVPPAQPRPREEALDPADLAHAAGRARRDAAGPALAAAGRCRWSRIEPPDEALLKAVLVKLFADRQLTVEPHVIDYLALHMERSMAAASASWRRPTGLALAWDGASSRALAAEALRSVSWKSLKTRLRFTLTISWTCHVAVIG